MVDVQVEVGPAFCRFAFITAPARTWGQGNFSALEVDIDIWRALHVINAIHAEGLRVTPYAAKQIQRIQRARLKGTNPERPRRLQSTGPLSVAAKPTTKRAASSVTVHRMVRQLRLDVLRPVRVDLILVEVFGATLLSVVLMQRLWHVAEPLLNSVRQWWEA